MTHWLHPSPVEVDEVVISWMNILPISQLDHGIWDYPGTQDYGSPGYGIGERVASRIVSERQRLASGYRTVQQLLAVPGFGEEKLEDTRIQASESIALARFRSWSLKPIHLWQQLQEAGPGWPLRKVVKVLRAHLTNLFDMRMDQVRTHFRIPFVALSIERQVHARDLNRPDIAHFKRVRFHPWAFAVHDPRNIWCMDFMDSYDVGMSVHLTPLEAN